ncbi:DB module family protein [Acanthocheilonema viteae]
MLRHRNLPIASVMHHQKMVNEIHIVDTARHVPFPNSNSFQFSMNENRTLLESGILPRINIHHDPFPSESQSGKGIVKSDAVANIRQREQQLLELATLKLAFLQTKVPASIVSNKQSLNTSKSSTHLSSLPQFVSPHTSERLSGIQPTAQRRKLKISRLPILTIVTPEPNSPTQQFAPQISRTNTLHRASLEPVLASQTTTLQPAHIALKQQHQSLVATKDIDEKILLSTNDAFLECCKQKNVDVKCESRCNFDILDQRMLTAMFVGSDPCPRSNGQRLLSCAAQDSDHTNCCRANGVQQTAAGDKCLGFCQMTPESNFQADISMLPCWGVLNEIKECFRLNLIEKYNIKKVA